MKDWNWIEPVKDATTPEEMRRKGARMFDDEESTESDNWTFEWQMVAIGLAVWVCIAVGVLL